MNKLKQKIAKMFPGYTINNGLTPEFIQETKENIIAGSKEQENLAINIMEGKSGWEYIFALPNGHKMYTDGKTIVNQFGKTCVWLVD